MNDARLLVTDPSMTAARGPMRLLRRSRIFQRTDDTRTDPITAGREALRRGAMSEAQECFEEALEQRESVEALEGLGLTARWLQRSDEAFDAHEHAYRLARAQGDRYGAGRVAVQLAYDAYSFRGAAEATGWAERAILLLSDTAPSAELAIAELLIAHITFLVRHDVAGAQEHAARALQVARAAGSVDGEMLALGFDGLVLVAQGSVEEGMRRLDAATTAAVAGEIEDLELVEAVCCYLIDACKRVRDYERASEWVRRVQDLSDRYGHVEMFAICRNYYADILVWRGEWAQAEAELTTAVRELSSSRRSKAIDSLVRLAELRRRQGRLDEAAALAAESEGHRLAPLVRGLIALDRDEPDEAADEAERFLRRIGEVDRFERVAGLELLVVSRLALGDLERAGEAAAEIDAVAERVRTPPLRACAVLAAGRIAAAQRDWIVARAALEDAADLYHASGAPYEAALGRLELASVLRALGRDAVAKRADDEARAALESLGAPRPASAPTRDSGPLTRRELEVLSLVSQGRSNEQIAAELVLSVRTVERHVSNIYDKIGASGRTARVVATAWAIARGLGASLVS